MFKRLLIANRGEIACRIIKTAKRLQLTTIAVYSDVDANALYVAQADEAFHIGPASARESYLNIEKIIETAKKTRADAIHPGYGFLSENADFAKACETAGIIFVGPASTHIRDMGLKDKAKALAMQYDCPVLPQYEMDKPSFPLLIKPVAGGGGKGMQIVEHKSEFATKLAAAQRQALASFNNDAVILEKYLKDPRHIEIQVLGDTFGHAVYLFERDCSLQRRYQKIIEQAPAPELSPALREKMGNAALKIVQGLHYVGAGTVEFLLDNDHEFYFMEMNTRLQVEHGVTELITGIDLVEWQLRIAAGEHLSLQQNDLHIDGVAIEARLYAEDPSEDFLPSTGTIAYLKWPIDARIDNGIKVGDEISIYYDPLLAKILVHADTHVKAFEKLSHALQDVHVAGVKTNLNFLRQLSINPMITQHSVDTHFIDTHQAQLCETNPISDMDCILAATGIVLKQNVPTQTSPWQINHAWRLNGNALQTIIFYHGQTVYELVVEYDEKGIKIYYENHIYSIDAVLSAHHLSAQINEQEYQRDIIFQENRIWLLGKENDIVFHLPIQGDTKSHIQDENTLRTPMPGKIVQLMVKEGDAVKANQPLVVLEAMKMEHTLYAPHKGTIKAIYFQVGAQVKEQETVVELNKD